jgi:hypothetical protein
MSHEDEIVHRKLETDVKNPVGQVVEIVAELEDTDIDELTTAWSIIDELLANLFTNPPAPEAQAQIRFSYEGYRITVEQNGNAKFVQAS